MQAKLLFLLYFLVIKSVCMDPPRYTVLPPGTIIEKDKTKPANDTILLAIERGDLEAVNGFITRGINLDERYTQIMNIPKREDTVIGPQIVFKTVYKIDKYFNTALMYATENGNLEIVKRLLEAGADPNLQNLQKHTALTLCTHTEVMKTLLKGGADPNIKTFNDNTALHYCIMRRDLIQTLLLLQHGSDPKITNHAGYSAEWYAYETGPKFTALLYEFKVQTMPSDYSIGVSTIENASQAHVQQGQS